MSASNIPNLLSLRGSRGGRAGRGRGRGGLASPGPTHDQTIQGTDDDAAGSRLSSVGVGYLDDPFAQYFVQSSNGPPPRRLPIINRGTYTRTCALDSLIDSFLSKSNTTDSGPKEQQIISLGAGTDTRSFRLFSGPNRTGLTYHEIDFPVTSSKKLRTVQAVPSLRQIVPTPSPEEDGSWSCRPPSGGQYWCHGLDLRELVQSDDATSIKGLRTDIPTLLISECCLCYLETSQAQDVIRWFSDKIPNIAIILYEPIKPDDPFGKMMRSNLAARRIRMPTLESYKDSTDQKKRLRVAGFDQVRAMSIEEIWETWISPEEKDRVDGLEGLDEVEEWKLLADHYIVAWGWRGSGFGLWDDGGGGA